MALPVDKMEVVKSKLSNLNNLMALTKMIEGAANSDGTWKKGWEPTVQSFIRKEDIGDYVVVHNLNKLNYAVSVSLVTPQPGTLMITDQTDVSFRLKLTRDKAPFDADFRFAISIIGD